MDRRKFLQAGAGGFALAGSGLLLPRALAAADLPSGAVSSGVLEALTGKQPLIKRSYRPPNFETPVEHLGSAITPNDRFFVRWHLSTIPEISAANWRLKVGGNSVERPFQLSFDQLRSDFEAVEITAVCQCSGNRRGLSDPHVPGVQWAYGAMGNARWRGARLKDVLARAGLKADALEVSYDGADSGALEKTPDFIKSLPMWKALDENTLIAYAMNGEPLPHWNGYPARIVVPGWTATYWLKQVVAINVEPRPEKNFWMSTAYRIPKGKFPITDRFLSQEGEANTPITEMVVNSLITNVKTSARLRTGQAHSIRGVAWDGGYGIRSVEVSLDGGNNWATAELEADLGRFSFRTWQYTHTPAKSGKLTIMARATNRQGSSQTRELIFNPAGYHNNVMERLEVDVL
ncbi:MAG: molybdopterin-dependent oxidoreductase [Rhodocyclaceae bacterium]|nr:molybdopterin-dependent oxidoreductase [Rhodocyclaceae bacterium]